MSVVALGWMVVLLLLNGFFVAAEFAYTAASRHELERRPGRASRLALAAIDELSFTLAGAQLGITICSLLLGAVAEPAVAAFIEAGVGALVTIPPTVLHTVSFIISMSIVVFLHMVIGEMAPKNIAITTPEMAARVMAVPYRAYTFVFRPLIWLLNGTANLGLRLIGIDPSQIGDPHSGDDLPSLIASGHRHGVVKPFAHRLLTGAIDLGELEATHVMVPRPNVVALPIEASLRDVEQLVLEVGHSRIPVYAGDLDDVRGFIHIKDLLTIDPADLDQPISAGVLRSLPVIPESAKVDRLLEEMRNARNHLALVIDEHGGTAGIVTMEDIVEEVVGEIRDEHDNETVGVRPLGPNRWLVDASLRPSEVRRASEVDLPEGEYDTVSGFVMDRLGRIPEVGDEVDDPAWRIRVRQMEGRRVGEIDLTRKPTRSNDE